jgi:hypothetical protein
MRGGGRGLGLDHESIRDYDRCQQGISTVSTILLVGYHEVHRSSCTATRACARGGGGWMDHEARWCRLCPSNYEVSQMSRVPTLLLVGHYAAFTSTCTDA